MSENEAKPEETELSDEAEGDEEFHPFDEVGDEYKPSVMHAMGEDGMPHPVSPDGSGKSDIPPLSCETLVCMEDASFFVIRGFFEEVLSEHSPEKVVRRENGKYYLKEEGSQEVFPIRPSCKHYVRQLAQFEHNAEHKVHIRLCAARRTTEGTFMTVRDTAMWACSMREPRDPKSEQLLEEFDKQKVAEGKKRVSLSIFKTEVSHDGK